VLLYTSAQVVVIVDLSRDDSRVEVEITDWDGLFDRGIRIVIIKT
jgi:hypothetical protein